MLYAVASGAYAIASQVCAGIVRNVRVSSISYPQGTIYPSAAELFPGFPSVRDLHTAKVTVSDVAKFNVRALREAGKATDALVGAKCLRFTRFGSTPERLTIWLSPGNGRRQ